MGAKGRRGVVWLAALLLSSGCPSEPGNPPEPEPRCGDGRVEPGVESCDGDCPESCTAPACMTARLVGTAATCDARCESVPIEGCRANDGCCPASCSIANDSDCSNRCGDGVVLGDELCDGDCPRSCEASACRTAQLVGTAATCDARCEAAPVETCGPLEGCCPSGCTAENDADCCAQEAVSLEQRMKTALDLAATNPEITTVSDFTVLLESADGRSYAYSHGSSTPSTSYDSASSSKLVAATVILRVADEGLLSLDSKPHDVIDFWTEESAITLRDLLSFTSGFTVPSPCGGAGQPPCPWSCIDSIEAEFEPCVRQVYEANIAASPRPAPGTQYVYHPNHLQIAGLMAVKATGKPWAELFESFKAATGLFATSRFDLPKLSNPRLAGGMHWTGSEYLAFLSALYHNRVPATGEPLLKSQALWDALFADQRGAATVAADDSPLWARLHEDWSYGLGNWLECPTATSGPGAFDCGAGHRNSSPGAYGAYPFVDFDADYVGIVARESPKPGTFPEGIATFRVIQQEVERWAALRCGR